MKWRKLLRDTLMEGRGHEETQRTTSYAMTNGSLRFLETYLEESLGSPFPGAFRGSMAMLAPCFTFRTYET